MFGFLALLFPFSVIPFLLPQLAPNWRWLLILAAICGTPLAWIVIQNWIVGGVSVFSSSLEHDADFPIFDWIALSLVVGVATRSVALILGVDNPVLGRSLIIMAAGLVCLFSSGGIFFFSHF
jgi:hypothetical protein